MAKGKRVLNDKHRNKWKGYANSPSELDEMFLNLQGNNSRPIIFSIDNTQDIKEIKAKLLDDTIKYMWCCLGVRDSDHEPVSDIIAPYVKFGNVDENPNDNSPGFELRSSASVDVPRPNRFNKSWKAFTRGNHLNPYIEAELNKQIDNIGSRIVNSDHANKEINAWLRAQIDICLFKVTAPPGIVQSFQFDTRANLLVNYSQEEFEKIVESLNAIHFMMGVIEELDPKTQKGWPRFTMILYLEADFPDKNKSVESYFENVAKPCPPICSEETN